MILLDTHVLVHYASDDRKLGKRARAAILLDWKLRGLRVHDASG